MENGGAKRRPFRLEHVAELDLSDHEPLLGGSMDVDQTHWSDGNKSVKTDRINAGAKWEDSEVVVDQGLITSRNPGD